MISSLNSYQEMASETANYPYRNTDFGICYTALGLSGEIGELIEIIEFFDYEKEDVVKEIGDVFWYISQLSVELGLNLSEIKKIINPISVNQIDLKTINQNLKYLGFVSGKICDKTKKLIRDGSIDKIYIKNKIAEVLVGLLNCCLLLDIDWREACQKNIDKLKSRLERGVLHGDGGNR